MKYSFGALFFVFLFLSGCYTVIKHPVVVDRNNPQFKHQVYFSDDCQSCHGPDADRFALGDNKYLPRIDYINNNARWSYFYSSPWWMREMFLTPPPSAPQGKSSSLSSSSARNRFPGASSGSSTISSGSTTRIAGGGNSGSTVTRSKTGTKTETSPASTLQRTQKQNENVREAVRGSGNTKKSPVRKTIPEKRKRK